MTYVRLSDEHMQQVRYAAEERFMQNEREMVSTDRERMYFRGFADGYLKCFYLYDCGHKKADMVLKELTGNPEDPKEHPHTVDNHYLEFIISTARENSEHTNIEQFTLQNSYTIGFTEGYTTCWNLYELHDLEDQMGEIVDPTPEEIELIQKLVSGWDLGGSTS